MNEINELIDLLKGLKNKKKSPVEIESKIQELSLMILYPLQCPARAREQRAFLSLLAIRAYPRVATLPYYVETFSIDTHNISSLL